MSHKHVKVAITGGAGQIGYALLFRIASGQMFGPNTSVDLHLLELELALPALNGVKMELNDCAFPLLNSLVCTADVNKAMRDVSWVLLIGAVPRTQGMERGDLLGVNGKIFTAQGRAINDQAASDVRVLVIGNPCNTNCLITMKNAPDIPNDRFYAMTMLDEKRARYQLAHKASVSVTDVTYMTIWGNHSATQYPDFYHAKIKGQSATQFINDEQWFEQIFVPTVQKRGAAIIEARGASSAASAAHGIVSSVYHLLHDTPENDSYSMSLCSQGQYEVDEGLIFSFPCQTKNGQLRVVEDYQHNDYARQKLQATLTELRQEKQMVQALGLIK